ncbi:protein translocase subunit SecD [Candidatus Gromoviella agglomerans]|uniref:protein translocase subunit SecD n=1 Tax=Candidatus Gromoviella agglomerans TaxID=2806609 RepID=UPI001E340EA6|nr:protein translocase subunit SecD [Candidatus Gromoviella agglomerans]UFX98346.1 Protein translocase subunit SecD [Candidatus Gromoviella agglomerans]
MLTIRRFFIFLCVLFFSCLSVLCILSNLRFLPKITLGLDLKGGSSILFSVEERDIQDLYMSDLYKKGRMLMRSKGVRFRNMKLNDENVLSFTLVNKLSQSDIESLVNSIDDGLSFNYKNLDNDQVEVKIFMIDSKFKSVKSSVVKRSIDVLNKRVNEFGTSEAIIMSYGSSAILVQIPNIFDIDHVKKVLGQTAQLRFCIVRDIISAKDLGNSGHDTFVMPSNDGSHYYILDKEASLSGDRLVDAQVVFGEYKEPMVSFKFDSIGANIFADITRKYIGYRMAIIFGDVVVSAPMINVAILDGNGVIQGNFDLKDAADMALMMRSGALPVKLEILEEKVIGAGLGEESIRKGMMAVILSILSVILCVIFMYKTFGLFANFSLIVNLLMTLSFLIIFGVTLTLPGIAGIALTIGMAIDANILINERIREELQKSTNLLSVVLSGYRVAMKTILDSNLTTIIGGLSLCIFGTGPIRGFGITLIIGLVVSLFTAVVLSRELLLMFIESGKYKNIEF